LATLTVHQHPQPAQGATGVQEDVAGGGEVLAGPPQRLLDLRDGVAADVDIPAQPVLGEAAQLTPMPQLSAEEAPRVALWRQVARRLRHQSLLPRPYRPM
jgi:hypothetical protein